MISVDFDRDQICWFQFVFYGLKLMHVRKIQSFTIEKHHALHSPLNSSQSFPRIDYSQIILKCHSVFDKLCDLLPGKGFNKQNR